MCHIVLLLPIITLPLFWLFPWEDAVFFYVVICFLSALFYWLLWQDMRRPAITGIEGMMGGAGTVFRCGNDKTKVYYRGEIWDAIGVDAMCPGEQVEIIGFERMKIVVRRKL